MRTPLSRRDRAVPHVLLLSLIASLLSGAAAPSQSPTCQSQGPLLNVTGGRFGDPWSVALVGPPGAAAVLGVDPAPGPVATPFGAVCVGLSGGLITTPVTLDAAGNFATGGLLPLAGGPPALTSLSLQAAVADPTLPFGFGLTNGWAVSFRPPRLGVFTSAVLNGTGVIAQGNFASIDPIADTVVSSTPGLSVQLSYLTRVPRLGWFAVPTQWVGLQFRDDVSGAPTLAIPGFTASGQYSGPAQLLNVSSDGSRLVVIMPATLGGGGPAVSVYGLPSGALLASSIPLFTSQGQNWAYPVPGTTLVYVADAYWVRVLDTSTATMVAQVFLPGTLNSIPLQAGNLLYSSTTAGLFAMDVTTHAIVLGPVPTGQPNSRLVAIGPGPAGPAVYAAGGSTATGYSLMACSPATLAVQGSVGLPGAPWVQPNSSQINLSAGGTEWLVDVWNPATSQYEFWAVNAATLQASFVMPSSGTTVLRSGTLRKAYVLTGPTTLVPIPTDPVGAPLPPITLPAAAGAVISN